MTLSAYSPNYNSFSLSDLQTAVLGRNIKCQSRDRKRLIRVLREADRIITFPFLDLPPELRNAVYKDLLAPSQTAENAPLYHPHILATCRQVHDEAQELLNNTNHAEIWLHVHKRKIRTSRGNTGIRSGLDVWFNGKVIFRTEQEALVGFHAYLIPWPRFLKEVRSVKVKMSLHADKDGQRMQEGHSIERALLGFDAFLSNTDAATFLDVDILLNGSIRDRNAFADIHPVCALAARFGNHDFKFSGISSHLQNNIHQGVTNLQYIYSLDEEVNLALKINLLTGGHGGN